jgi:energy-coupling factor transport system permease protein
MNPGAERQRPPLATLNPLVAFLVVLIVAVAMIVAFDPLSAGIVLAAESALVVSARLPAGQWLLRIIPLALALLGIVIANLLFSAPSGRLLVDLGIVQISSGSLVGALTVALRLLALALPGIVMFAALDPTELSDALITHWHANPRIAVGSLAAVRMAPLVAGDLRQSYAARRTRGVLSRNPVRGAGLVFGTVAAVLITAIRRATRLSVAMDARGFDAGLPRTVARLSLWRTRDSVVVASTVAVCAIAVAASKIAAG